MNYEFEREILNDELIEEMRDILMRHWLEIARHQDKVRLEPDWGKYKEIQKSDSLVLTVSRLHEKIVGYIFNFVFPNIHYKSCLVGQNDVIFIDKEHRKGNHAKHFIQFTEKVLQNIGVKKFILTLKVEHDFSVLLERMKYEFIEKVYEKTFWEV